MDLTLTATDTEDHALPSLWSVLKPDPALRENLRVRRAPTGPLDMSSGAIDAILVSLQPGVLAALTQTLPAWWKSRARPEARVTIEHPVRGKIEINLIGRPASELRQILDSLVGDESGNTD